MKVGGISALLDPLTYIVVNLAIVAVIQQGGYRAWNGEMLQGEVVALVNYLTQILIALIVFGTAYRHAYKGGCVRDKDCGGYGTRTRYERGQCRER